MHRRGLTLVELLIALSLAGLLVGAAVRLLVASSRQGQAVLEGTALQAEVRRGLDAAQQAVGEGPFLLPLRGGPLGLEYLQAVERSGFTVLEVRADGLVVRLLDASYDPRSLRWAVVVDAGGNAYVYALQAAQPLDGASGLWILRGTSCLPPRLPARGVGASRVRLGEAGALASFAPPSWPGASTCSRTRPPRSFCSRG